MSAAGLIAEARAMHARLDGTTNVCAIDDNDWPCITKQLADALEAAEFDCDALVLVVSAVRVEATIMAEEAEELYGPSYRETRSNDGANILEILNGAAS